MHVKPEVEVVPIVGDIDIGGLGRWCSVEGRLLNQLGDFRGRPPRLIVQAAIDFGWGVRPDGAYPWTTGERAEIDVVSDALRRRRRFIICLCGEGAGDRGEKKRDRTR